MREYMQCVCVWERGMYIREKRTFLVSLLNTSSKISNFTLSLLKCINALGKKNKLVHRSIIKKYQIHIKAHPSGLNDGAVYSKKR